MKSLIFVGALISGFALVTPDCLANAYVQVAAGGFHTVGLCADGTVWVWGNNLHGLRGHGILGDGSMGVIGPKRAVAFRFMPVQVKGGDTAGLKSFQLADVNHPVVDLDVRRAEDDMLSGITAVAAGLHFTLALGEDGAVWAWGSNAFGQLGDGSEDFSFPFCRTASLPLRVRGAGGKGYLTGVTAIAAGYHHSVAVGPGGCVWTWGLNSSGQLGNDATHDLSTPVPVMGPGGQGHLTDVTAVAAGATHTIALRDDGTVWAWGDNSFGQLGDGTREDRHTPVQVKGTGGKDCMQDARAVAAGVAYTVALRQDGTVWAWGNNTFGQLGDGTREHRSTPVRVTGVGGAGHLADITAITAGRLHVAALKADGTVTAWGSNEAGELGDGTVSCSATPVPVKGAAGAGYLSGIVGITAGHNDTVALRDDGTVWSWGANSHGQLGNVTTVASCWPVQLREMPEPPQVAYGEGRWLLWTSGVQHNPGWVVPVTGEKFTHAFRHHIATPTKPERGDLRWAKETEVTLLDFTAVSNRYLTISFDLRVSSPASRTLDITLFREKGLDWKDQAWSLVWGKSPGKFSDLGGDLGAIDGTWHNYTVVSDLDNYTYDVWMDGDRVAENRTFRSKPDKDTPYGRLQIGATHGNMITRGGQVVDGEYADIANIRINTKP